VIVRCLYCDVDNRSGAMRCTRCGAALEVLEGDRRPLTVLFCDLLGSTPLSQELDPEELADLVHRYQKTCADIVATEGGYTAQYLGDGILIYFGYPEAHEDDARRSVLAGLRIVEGVSKISVRGRPLQVRVGIHTGIVVVGPVGSGPSSQRLALGGAPNVAARVQGQAEANQVLLTDATRRLVEGYFAFEDLKERPLAGLPPTRLFRVRGETGAASRLDAARPAGLTPFVGRRKEVQAIVDRLTSRGAHGVRSMLVRGEPGIGKSRLLDVVKAQVAIHDFRLLGGGCSPQHRNTPLYAISSMFFDWLGAKHDASDLATRLRGALERLGAPASVTDPLGAALLSVFDSQAPQVPGTTPQRRMREVTETIRKWWGLLASGSPLLVSVEDLHWADPTTFDLLDLLVRDPQPSVFLVVTTRPELEPTWRGLPAHEDLQLDPLSPTEVHEMVSAVVGHALLEEITRNVFRETDGIPLFVEEVTRARVEGGLSGEPPSVPGSTAPPVSIPAKLHGPLMARLDRLGSAKAVAQKASVLGREFSADLLAALDQPEDDEEPVPSSVRDIQRLVAAGLLVHATQDAYAFKHALVRDAAYASLLRPARQAYHRRAGAALEQSPAGAHQDEIVAMHFEEGGSEAKAAKYWRAAGMKALGRSANREAIVHLERALRLVERAPDAPERQQGELELHMSIAPALMAINGWSSPQVEASCRRALELSQVLGAGQAALQAMWGLWSVSFVRGYNAVALEVAQQLHESVRALGNPVLTVMSHHALTFTLLYAGRFVEAERCAEGGLGLLSLEQEKFVVEQLQLSSTVCLGNILALVLCLRGRHADAKARLDAAGALADQLGHPPTLAFHLNLRCELHLWQRDAVELHETAKRVRALAEAEGIGLWVATATFYEGLGRAWLGDVAHGLSEMASSRQMYERMGAGANTSATHGTRVELLTQLGRLDEATALLNEADAWCAKSGETYAEAEMTRLRGEILAQRGDADGALAKVHKAVEIATAQEAWLLADRAKASLMRISSAGQRTNGAVSGLVN
jgi:class 3 adenylate cyclase/tetratricopeptide (TPR) repeat protein